MLNAHLRWSGLIAGSLAVLASILVVSSPVEAQAAPTWESVEIRPDRTLELRWAAVSGASTYEIAFRQAGGSWQTVSRTEHSDLGTVRRIVRPDAVWPGEYNTDYEFAIRSGTNGSFSTPAPVRLVKGSFDIASTTGGPGSITIEWDDPQPGESIERFDTYITGQFEFLPNCKMAEIADPAARTYTFTSQVEDCRKSALLDGAGYTVGVRKVYNAEPLVVSEIAAATGFVAGTSASPEKIRTDNVDGLWSIVDMEGEPRIMRGINMRRGELTQYAFQSSEFNGVVFHGFDVVRLAIDWDRFQPAPDELDFATQSAVDRTLRYAEVVGVDVILDVIHLEDDGLWGIPQWAWDASNEGVVDPTKITQVVRENAGDFLTEALGSWRDRTNLIGFDLLNEPREPAESVADRPGVMIELYHDLIETARDVDPTAPLLIQPYYGSALLAGERIAEIRDATTADPDPDPADFENLVWSMHDYYAGVEGTATDDGYSNGGYPLRGTTAAGDRLRTESWVSTACYPSGPSASQCTEAIPRRGITIPSMSNHVEAHFNAAQRADMPLFIGEFGIPHSGQGYQGWGGGAEFFSDKNEVYDGFGIGRAVWSWRVDVDPTFGLYDRATRNWHEWTDYASGKASIAPPKNSGDVNCDGVRNIVDTLLITQWEVRTRTDKGSCPLDDPTTQLFAAVGDLNNDGITDVVDALLIAQCSVGVEDLRC